MKKLKLFLAIIFLNACNSSDGDGSSYVDFVYGECTRNAANLMPKKKNMTLDNSIEELSCDEAEKIAILTNSNGKTLVHLTSVYRYCASNAKIKKYKIADTLKLEEYFPKDNYDVSSCICCSTMDLTLESIDNEIQYVIYGKQVFPVRFER